MKKKREKFLASLGITAMGLLLLLSAAHAAVLTVPTSYPTVQSAINAARFGDTVEVAPGVYRENITLRNGVTVQGSGMDTCTLQGDGTSSVVSAENVTAGISGFTITGGKGTVPTWNSLSTGGGISANSADLTITNNRIEGNTAGFGGGIALIHSRFLIENTQVVSNHATVPDPTESNQGGGIYLLNSHGEIKGSVISENLVDNGIRDPGLLAGGGKNAPGGGIFVVFDQQVGDVIISGNVIENNTAEGSQHYGGGIYCRQDNSALNNTLTITGNQIRANKGLDGGGIAVIEFPATIRDNEISENEAHWGGGLYGFKGGGTIEHNVFRNNKATVIRNEKLSGGGGILCEVGFSPVVRQNTFTGNTAVNHGGGMEIYDEGTSPVVQENIFTDNSAEFGGGIYIAKKAFPKIVRNYIKGNEATPGSGGGIFVEDTLNFQITNNLIVENKAAQWGGGISVANGGNPDFINNTVVGNSADNNGSGSSWGGGIHSYNSSFGIVNNIVMNNKRKGIVGDNGNLTLTYNDVYNNTDGDYFQVTPGTGSITKDPQFADTKDYRLNSGSPCIDTGDPAYKDPDGSRSDMGAYGGPAAGTIPLPGQCELGGSGAGSLVQGVIDTSRCDSFTLLLSQQPPQDITGRLYISVEAPTILADYAFFRVSDSKAPPYVQVAKTPMGFLAGAEDNHYFQGALGKGADIRFEVKGIEGLKGQTLVSETLYLEDGTEFNESNLKRIQRVEASFQ